MNKSSQVPVKRRGKNPGNEAANTSKKIRKMSSTRGKDSGKIKQLVFWPSDEIQYVRETLEKSFKESRLHLEFHVNELFSIPEKTWKVCGPKVRSVIWYSIPPGITNYETSTDDDDDDYDDDYDCPGSSDEDDESDKEDRKYRKKERQRNYEADKYRLVQSKYGDVWWSILLNCPQLEQFEHRSKYSTDEDSTVKVLSKELLQKLIKANIVREGVRTLAEPVILDELQTGEIFQVFPNITQLSLSEENMPQMEELSIKFSKLPRTIVQLHFSSDEYQPSHLFSSYIQSPYVNIKLKELKAATECVPHINNNPLLKLFNQLNELEVLELDVFYVHLKKESAVEKFKAELIIRILNSCINLTKLTIRFKSKSRHGYAGNREYELSDDESSDNETQEDALEPAVGNVAEKILKLYTFEVIGFENVAELLVPAMSMEDKEDTKLQCLYVPHASKILRSSLFKNMTYLSIEDSDLNEMRTICEFQENLKTLIVDSLKEANCWDNEPKEAELMEQLNKFKTIIPSRSFEKLEHLEMGDGIYMMFIVFNEFHCPSLKHLVLTEVDDSEGPWMLLPFIREHMYEIFDCLPQKVPLLEIFHSDLVYNFKRNLPSYCVQFVKRMKNMEILSFSASGNQYPMTTKCIIRVYKMQRRLKVVVSDHLIFYNRKTKRIVSKDDGGRDIIYVFKRDPCCNAFHS